MAYWYWALAFLIFGVIAAVLGFTRVAGASFAAARLLALVFLLLFLSFALLGSSAAGRLTG